MSEKELQDIEKLISALPQDKAPENMADRIQQAILLDKKGEYQGPEQTRPGYEPPPQKQTKVFTIFGQQRIVHYMEVAAVLLFVMLGYTIFKHANHNPNPKPVNVANSDHDAVYNENDSIRTSPVAGLNNMTQGNMHSIATPVAGTSGWNNKTQSKNNIINPSKQETVAKGNFNSVIKTPGNLDHASLTMFFQINGLPDIPEDIKLNVKYQGTMDSKSKLEMPYNMILGTIDDIVQTAGKGSVVKWQLLVPDDPNMDPILKATCVTPKSQEEHIKDVFGKKLMVMLNAMAKKEGSSDVTILDSTQNIANKLHVSAPFSAEMKNRQVVKSLKELKKMGYTLPRSEEKKSGKDPKFTFNYSEKARKEFKRDKDSVEINPSEERHWLRFDLYCRPTKITIDTEGNATIQK